MVFIYVLKLVNNKYYIGKTTNPRFRLGSHFNKETTSWVTKYHAEQIIELVPDCDDYDEDKFTIKYMKKYGISNVRGGSFCEIILSRDNYSTLQKMIKGSEDKCYTCGKSGHYASACFEILEEVWECEYCGKEFDSERGTKMHETKWCKSNPCKGGYNTSSINVGSIVIINGIKSRPEINGEIVRVLKQHGERWVVVGNFGTMVSKQLALKPIMLSLVSKRMGTTYANKYDNVCYKCGRYGHYANSCYTKRDVVGNALDMLKWFQLQFK